MILHFIIHSQTFEFNNSGFLSDTIEIDLGAVFYPDISGFTIAPTSVNSGQKATGTVTLDNPATGDTVINLKSLNTTWATVPETLTVPAGQQQADFEITTQAVTGSPTVTIEVSYRKITALSNLVINGSP